METIGLSINGKKIACTEGTRIFEAAAANGIAIPSLCYHPDLHPHGACRLCLVEDEKSGRLFASCVTPAARDMAIQTESPRVIEHRRNIIRLMMAEHPESCIVCSKGNRCELRRIAARLGVGENDLYPMPNYKPFEQLNPFIARDLSKCILCGRCIRADHDLVCTGAIDYNNRGFPSRPATAHDLPLEQSNCTFCGTCVSICPTGALSAKNNRYVGSPETEGLSVCGFCGIGCSLKIGAAGGRVVDVNPAGLADTVNRSTLCVRGHFAHDFLNSADRLTAPLIKPPEGEAEDGAAPFSETSWEEAITRVAERLSDIKRNFGPQSIAFIGGAQCSIEENYLFQKIARAVFQSENITNTARSAGPAARMALDRKTLGTSRSMKLADLEKAAAIVVIGPDPDHAAPVLSYHIKRAARDGAALLVVNPLPNELAFFASRWIRPGLAEQPPTSLTALLNGISKALLARGGHAREFINARTKGLEAYTDVLAASELEELARLAGVSAKDLESAAEILSGKPAALVCDPAAFGCASETGLSALFNLALLTGSMGDQGAGIYLTADASNRMGACDMGALPDWLPGRIPISDKAGRELFEKAWNTKISPDPGLSMDRLIEAAESGSLKAAYIMGENPLRKLPQPERAAGALQKLDFLVVQDILYTRTARLADVVLPAAAFTEKAGAFTNMEGRIQNFSPISQPPGEALPDWKILAMLAARMGYPERYDTPEQIKQEIRRLVPMYADLGSHRQAWLKSENGGGREPIRFEFAPAEIPAPAAPADKPSEADYPYAGIVGPLRLHMGGGTRTGRSERIASYTRSFTGAFNGSGQIEISSTDARALDLAETDRLRLQSPHGRIEGEYRINAQMAPGRVFIPLGAHGNQAMQLLPFTEAAHGAEAGWQVCRLKMEKIKNATPGEERV